MMRIRYMIGAKCNFHCSYCIITKGTKKFIETENDDVLYKAINTCKEHGKTVDRLLITGGEPTLYRERVLEILENVKNIKQVMINSNLTNLDVVKEFLSYDNVGINISWDGEVSDRDKSIYDNIKTLINECGMSKIRINYVITPTSYIHMLESMKKLDLIKKGLSLQVEHSIISAPKEEYQKFNLKLLKEELEKVFLYSPVSPVFNTATKNCPHITKNDYIDIQNGKIYYGCCEGICFYDVATDMDRMFYCKDPANDMCMNCDNEFCAVCGLKLDKLANGLKRNEKNFFCDYYGIIKEICYKYKEYYDFIKNYYKRNMLYEINLTWDCNLKCKYCFEENKIKNYMSYETLDKIIYLMSINAYNGDGLNIEFFGGEPLLKKCLDKIKYTIFRIKNLNIKEQIKINIITNGTNYNEEIKNIFKEILLNDWKLNIQISLDGIKECHNMNRCNSFDFVIENIYKIKKDFKDINLSTNSVITNENIIYLKENMFLIDKLYKEKIIDNFSFRFVQRENKDIDYNLIKEKIEEIILIYKENLMSKNILKSIVQFDDINNTSQKGCGMCYNMITFSPEGNIIPCHRIETDIIANINDEYSFEKAKNKIDFYSSDCNFIGKNNENCINCKYNHLCLKCKAANYEINKNINLMPKHLCKITKMIGELLDKHNIDFHIEMIDYKMKISKYNQLSNLYKEYLKLKENNKITEEEENIILEELHKLSNMIKE